MFEALARAIDEVEILPRGDAIVEAVALRDRLSAKIAQAVGDFDDARLWDLEAATSMTAWLRDKAAMTGREAARTASASKRLRSLPVTAAAWRSGELSSGQVEAVLAHLDRRTLGLFSDHEASVIPSLVGLSVTDTARAMAHWKAHASAVCDDPEPPERERSLHVSKTLGGGYALDGDLDPEGGATVATALRVAGSDDVEAEPARSPAERRADALVDICRFFLDHQRHRRGGRHRPHVNVVVDLDDLLSGRGGQVVDGGDLDRSSIEALLCDCALHRVVMKGRSAVLDYGTSTRTVPSPCGTPWWCATRGAGSRAATGPRRGATPTTWCGSSTTVRPASRTWSWCAPATTTASTSPAGTPSSDLTPPWRSPTPTGSSAPPPRRGRDRWRRRRATSGRPAPAGEGR